ncbi:probable transcription factor KAN2 isoform X3 [Zingiber officinale]|uniref:probable transcription factor KAN2 isoform X3 n=1 Tax=Zingiber officinale TaxID=94328 RepID=UPI001C4CBA85|nr:probable transcription factor KAN2 isoform X3 [Zingiber officinale]
MEFFSAQPDLSLRISPPSATSTDESIELGFWRKPSVSTASSSPFAAAAAAAKAGVGEATSTDFTLKTSPTCPYFLHFDQHHHQDPLSLMKPIRGIPVYDRRLPLPFTLCDSSSSSSNSLFAPAQLGLSRMSSPRYYLPPQRLFAGKRGARAPRMRWTATLHARFVHAVELLGGHERATPKSVLELMDVKDLTLAHVKSHLQMYRTVKNTDHRTSASDLKDNFEGYDQNGLSRELVSDDNSSEGPNLLTLGSTMHQGRESYLNGELRNTAKSLKKDMETRNMEVFSELSPSKLNLDFTLGRPQ